MAPSPQPPAVNANGATDPVSSFNGRNGSSERRACHTKVAASATAPPTIDSTVGESQG